MPTVKSILVKRLSSDDNSCFGVCTKHRKLPPSDVENSDEGSGKSTSDSQGEGERHCSCTQQTAHPKAVAPPLWHPDHVRAATRQMHGWLRSTPRGGEAAARVDAQRMVSITMESWAMVVFWAYCWVWI